MCRYCGRPDRDGSGVCQECMVRYEGAKPDPLRLDSDNPCVIVDRNGVIFRGPTGVSIYRATVLAHALRLWAEHRIKPNRHYTPSRMMEASRETLRQLSGDAECGRDIGAREYGRMAEKLDTVRTSVLEALCGD